MKNEWARKLLAIQKIERVIDNKYTIIKVLKTKLEKLQKCIEGINRDINQMYNKIEEYKNLINCYNEKILKLNIKIEELKEKGLLKFKQRAYDTLQNELNIQQSEKMRLKNEIKELLDCIKYSNHKIEMRKHYINSELFNKRNDKKIELIEKIIRKNEEKIEKNNQIKSKIIKNTENEYIQTYMTLKRRYNNPIVPTINELICSNCNIQLTSQIVCDVKNNKFTLCNSCGCILYSTKN